MWKLENSNLEKYSKYIGNVMYILEEINFLDDWFGYPDFLKLFEKTEK